MLNAADSLLYDLLSAKVNSMNYVKNIVLYCQYLIVVCLSQCVCGYRHADELIAFFHQRRQTFVLSCLDIGIEQRISQIYIDLFYSFYTLAILQLKKSF